MLKSPYHSVRKNLRHAGLNLLIIVLILVFAALMGILYGVASGLMHLPDVVLAVLRVLATFIGMYLFATVFIRLTLRRIESFFEDKDDVESRLLLGKLYTAAMYALATFVVLYYLGVTLDNITIVLGLFATAMAFAIRDVILSYLVWMVLLTKRPFRIGDYIRIGDEQGRVMHIGTFFVLLDDSPERKEDFVRVPNRVFFEKPVHNFGHHDVPVVVRVHVESLPGNLSEFEQGLLSAVSGWGGASARMVCDVVQKDFVVQVECLVPFSRRRELRDRIVRHLSMLAVKNS